MRIVSLTTVAALLASAAAIITPVGSTAALPDRLAAAVTTELPRGIAPVRYDLTIEPHEESMTFDAHATIIVEVSAPTARIVLNAADLKFGKVTVTPTHGAVGMAARTMVDEAHQTVALVLDEALAPGRYEIALAYTGKIQRSTAGFFALDYRGADGKPRKALFTQFENSDARRLFPSWDEPAYKALFGLKTIIPAGETAISNMPVTSRTITSDGRQTIAFADTPKMSTYLLFLGVGDLERAAKVVDGVEVGVVTQRGRLDQANFALDAAAQVLPFYNAYFGTAYPLPKLDNIAGPGQSQTFGAMENWGSIFSFERSFLLDPATASEGQKTAIFETIAHEMAHQWFGDLVTMRWWDDLWLNEGFASWMEGEATAHFHPEWSPEFEILTYRDEAMGDDALATSHPVVQHVATSQEASEAFDAITYMKGQAVIRMLQTFVGPVAWREAVSAYIRKHAYGSTTTGDLWTEVDAVSGHLVSQIAHDFTLQSGVPLIRVSSACIGGATILSLQQGEWSKDHPDKVASLWHVPVIASHPGGSTVRTVVVRSGRLSVPGCGPVVVNAGQNGYYRTLYQPAMFADLARSLAKIAPIDQMGLITDAAALGLSGYQPISGVLDLIDRLPATAASAVLENSARTWSRLYGYADGDASGQAGLRLFGIRHFLPALERLGWLPRDNEPASDSNLRATLIEVLGDAVVPEVVTESKRRFAADTSGVDAIPPSLRKAILAVVARNADQDTWDRLHAMAQRATSAQQRQALYRLLGSARDPRLQNEALELALTDEPGPSIGPSIIKAVAVTDAIKALDFANAHMAAILKQLDSLSASTFIPGLAFGGHEAAAIDKLKSYEEQQRTGGSARPSAEAIAAIQDNMRVRARTMPAVYQWLTAKGF